MAVREYLVPGSVPEAVGLLKTHGSGLLVMAGGTVVMSLINEGLVLPERVMSLRGAGLDRIEADGDVLRIGATVTLTRLIAEDRIPLLTEATRSTGTWPVRNMATVAGNLFTVPRGGDIAVALLALDARVLASGPRGERAIEMRDFFAGTVGTALAPDELVTGIEVPASRGDTAYVKFGRKRANTPAVVTVAVALQWSQDVVQDARIALGAVGPHPVRATAAEDLVRGSRLEPDDVARASQAAAAACESRTDAIATAWYRERMVPVIVGRALERIRGGR